MKKTGFILSRTNFLKNMDNKFFKKQRKTASSRFEKLVVAIADNRLPLTLRSLFKVSASFWSLSGCRWKYMYKVVFTDSCPRRSAISRSNWRLAVLGCNGINKCFGHCRFNVYDDYNSNIRYIQKRIT